MVPTVRHADEALVLRRLAISVLRGREGQGSGDWRRAAAMDQTSWRLFLHIERCAPALAAGGSAYGDPLGEVPVLGEHLREDAQRALSLRSHLVAIGSAARELNLRVAVLKGGVPISGDRVAHLQDLDVLVPADRAEEFARALAVRLGARHEGPPAERHLAPLSTPGALPIEVHTTIDTPSTELTRTAWERIVPLDGVPGLWRLSAPDHLFHTVTHVVTEHPPRRGQLRDSLIIAAAWEKCTPGERVEVAERLARHSYAGPLRSQLEFSAQFVDGRPVNDPFETLAYAEYWLRAQPAVVVFRQALAMRKEFLDFTDGWVIALLLGGRETRKRWSRIWTPSPGRASLATTAFVERHARRLGRLLRLSLRMVFYCVTIALAWPVFLAARRAARRAGASVPIS